MVLAPYDSSIKFGIRFGRGSVGAPRFEHGVAIAIPVNQRIAVIAEFNDALPLTLTIPDGSDIFRFGVAFRYQRFDSIVVMLHLCKSLEC
jgi:hypothetical protein